MGKHLSENKHGVIKYSWQRITSVVQVKTDTPRDPCEYKALGNHLPLSSKEAVQYTAPVYKVLFIDPLTPFIP